MQKFKNLCIFDDDDADADDDDLEFCEK